MEEDFYEFIDKCTNSIKLEDAQALIDFLHRMREESLTQEEINLLNQLLKLEKTLELPTNPRARQFLFRGIIESVRGRQAATERGDVRPKRDLMEGILSQMIQQSIIQKWQDVSRSGRYDYKLTIAGQKIYLEAKGGFDGNSTRISEFPPDATETWKWFMVEGSPKNTPSSQVKKNRLLGDMVRKQKAETGFMVLDYLCGDPEVRPCPKPSLARLQVLPHLDTPFPDIFLLPQTPWQVAMMNWAVFDFKNLSSWLDALMKLWQLNESELPYHVHLVGVELTTDNKYFRWGMRRLNQASPWYTSQFRPVR
ncbi:MAG: hypothetical protein HC880_06780 [Bacteroidia bacterium]|nr:hypothetical protein [Bacteroidia bacterium]